MPKFEHDCKNCRLLGEVTINGKLGEVYVHPHNDPELSEAHNMRLDSVLVRFSDEPGDYLSTHPQYFCPLDPWAAVAIALWARWREFTGWNWDKGVLVRKGSVVIKLWEESEEE